MPQFYRKNSDLVGNYGGVVSYDTLRYTKCLLQRHTNLVNILEVSQIDLFSQLFDIRIKANVIKKRAHQIQPTSHFWATQCQCFPWRNFTRKITQVQQIKHTHRNSRSNAVLTFISASHDISSANSNIFM